MPNWSSKPSARAAEGRHHHAGVVAEEVELRLRRREVLRELLHRGEGAEVEGHEAHLGLRRSAARRRCSASCPRFGSRQASTTRAPFAARARAVSKPMPLFAPVTTATRPLWSGMSEWLQSTVAPPPPAPRHEDATIRGRPRGARRGRPPRPRARRRPGRGRARSAGRRASSGGRASKRGQAGRPAWAGRPLRAKPSQAPVAASARASASGPLPANFSAPGVPIRPKTKGTSMPWQAPRRPPKQRRLPGEEVGEGALAVGALGLGEAHRGDAEQAVALDGGEELGGRGAGARLAVGAEDATRSWPGARASRRRRSPASSSCRDAGSIMREEPPLVAGRADEDVHVLREARRGSRRSGRSGSARPSTQGRKPMRQRVRRRRPPRSAPARRGSRRPARRGAPRGRRPATPSSRQKSARTRAAASAVFTVWAAPLIGTARSKRPWAAGMPSRQPTLIPPADSPKTVTFAGSPPKAADVLAHPAERRQLVEEAQVRRRVAAVRAARKPRAPRR